MYCTDCEIEIKLLSFFDMTIGNATKEEKPVKFKSGWKCAKCAKKR